MPKRVLAIIKPWKLEAVLSALEALPLAGCELREVRGYGRQKGQMELYRGSEYAFGLLPKVAMELWVEDSDLEAVLTALADAARTGRIGDGKVFVLPLAAAAEMEELAGK